MTKCGFLGTCSANVSSLKSMAESSWSSLRTICNRQMTINAIIGRFMILDMFITAPISPKKYKKLLKMQCNRLVCDLQVASNGRV